MEDMTPRTKKKMINESMGTRAAAEALDIVVPIEFKCPITNEVMIQPLMTRQGQNFERTAIIAWLQIGDGENPITDEPLSPSELIPNRALEEKIAFWRWENMLPEPSEHKKKLNGDSMSDITAAVNGRIESTENIIGIVSPRKKKVQKVFLRRLAARMIGDKDNHHDLVSEARRDSKSGTGGLPITLPFRETSDSSIVISSNEDKKEDKK